jgi:mycothiol synthase
MQTDAAAPAAGLPGLVIRPYAGEPDIPEIVRLTNADLAADGVRERFNVDELTIQFRRTSDAFDPMRDVLMAESDGVVVGTVRIDWVDTTDGKREFRSRGAVDPAWRRRGIGRSLLTAAFAVMRDHLAESPTDRPVAFGMFIDEKQIAREALARSEGYQPVRWFFEMERSVEGELPAEPPLPDGIQVRPASRDDAHRIWDADHEAFRDHWGGSDSSEGAFLRWVESVEFQPDLFVVAWDGDEIAGAVLNTIYHDENAELGMRRGWLDSVFTRRPWRGRGLARALIVRSLRVIAEHGMDTAALGVDADNPSGALRLYESCGFAVRDRAAAWQRPLEVAR